MTVFFGGGFWQEFWGLMAEFQGWAGPGWLGAQRRSYSFSGGFGVPCRGRSCATIRG
ncbi:hypothetical protein SBA4_3510002 [Candidatus Sulfopaludibacter sp. SbA4]|nr:hypothetical protein SBA4_3510002 [Candidatus Sulfopaludibacter sp. SbA4]